MKKKSYTFQTPPSADNNIEQVDNLYKDLDSSDPRAMDKYKQKKPK